MTEILLKILPAEEIKYVIPHLGPRFANYANSFNQGFVRRMRENTS